MKGRIIPLTKRTNPVSTEKELIELELKILETLLEIDNLIRHPEAFLKDQKSDLSDNR